MRMSKLPPNKKRPPRGGLSWMPFCPPSRAHQARRAVSWLPDRPSHPTFPWEHPGGHRGLSYPVTVAGQRRICTAFRSVYQTLLCKLIQFGLSLSQQRRLCNCGVSFDNTGVCGILYLGSQPRLIRVVGSLRAAPAALSFLVICERSPAGSRQVHATTWPPVVVSVGLRAIAGGQCRVP